jgi:hypothetical protein
MSTKVNWRASEATALWRPKSDVHHVMNFLPPRLLPLLCLPIYAMLPALAFSNMCPVNRSSVNRKLANLHRSWLHRNGYRLPLPY